MQLLNFCHQNGARTTRTSVNFPVCRSIPSTDFHDVNVLAGPWGNLHITASDLIAGPFKFPAF